MSLDILQRMVTLKKVDFEDGIITIFGRTVAFMPIEVMLEMHEWVESEIGKEKADRFMFDVGKYQTKSGSIKYLATKEELRKIFTNLPETGDPSMEMGRETLKFAGWGDNKIVRIDSGGNKIVMKTVVSPIAKEYLKTRGKSKEPVCHYMRGIFAGVFEAVRGEKYDCKETSCAATGMSENCIFELTKRA